MNKIILKDDDATNKFGQLIASKILALDKRSKESHKGNFGKVLVYGGSNGMGVQQFLHLRHLYFVAQD